MNRFEDLGIESSIAKAIGDMGWTEPTPIQTEAIPAGIEGRDIIAQAQTGTGKTGAYISIVLARIRATSRKPSALILAPTRELANQIEEEVYKLSKYSGHSSMAIYGGASIDNQIRNIRKGRDVVVGTPGRLKDLLTRKMLDLSHVTEVVFDEADRMLDMGFANELNFIMDLVPSDRQTLLFSATMDKGIKNLAKRYMRDPLEISVSKNEICSDLTEQSYVSVSKGDKQSELRTILDKGLKTIVFCQTKRMVDRLHKDISKDYSAGAIHGGIAQNKREKVIKSYRNDSISVLIATDVAARGIDVNNIGCVVNFDMPMDVETYLHRIGRTGRAGQTGFAVSFVTRPEEGIIRTYENRTGKKILRIRADELGCGYGTTAANTEKSVTEVKTAVPENMKKGMVPLQINLGKKDRMNRTQISDFVKKNANLDSSSVGRIGLGDSTSYMEIFCDHIDATINALTGRNCNGKSVSIKIAPKKTAYKSRA